MFNGIVYNQGTIKSLRRNPKYVRGSLVIEVASNIRFKKTDIGESVSCDGVCLTLIRIKKSSFLFYLSKETLNRSNFKNIKIGKNINIEKSLYHGKKISGHYVNSILAKTEATLAGFDEAIMLTPDGYVSEGSGEHLFMVNGNKLVTPPVADNNLTGITRDSSISIACDELGMELEERRIRRSELYFAEEVFLTGTAAHIQAVGELDNRPIGTGFVGEVTSKINVIYQKAIRGENPKYSDWCTEIKI